jgi:DNA-binding beta-propeller fold protein YncE
MAVAALGLILTAAAIPAEKLPTREVKFIREITGGAAGPLSLPTDVAVDSDKIYVVDGGNHRVVVFDHQGKYLFAVGGEGSGPGKFRGLVGIGAGVNDQFYVADTQNHRVQVFDAKGKHLYGFPISSLDKPIRPIDVAVDPKGKEFYVTGNNNHKVMVFSSDGSFVREWGGGGLNPGEFRYPGSITFMRDARVAVVDILNTRLQVFEQSGEFSIEIGQWGVLPGNLFRPKGVAVDNAGRLYVSDSYMNLIQVYSDTGRFLYVLRMRGSPHPLDTPVGIAIDGENQLYITEMTKNRLSVFGLEP